MKKHLVSRRNFLRSSTLALGAWPAGMSWSNSLKAASLPDQDSGAPSIGESDSVSEVYRDICPEYVSLLLKRSEMSHQQLQSSLREYNARPVVLSVFQKRNHCGGESGKTRNLDCMLATIGRAARENVQILVFPEMALPGFTDINGSPADARIANRGLADTLGQSRYLTSLQDAAQKAKMVTTFGFCLQENKQCYNAIGVIDADGTWLGVRRKNPLYPWPYEVDSFDQPGPEERSAVFASRYGRIGVADCFDGEFPESIRSMRLAGAEILLWSNAAVGNSKLGGSNRINYSGCYAQTNHMWVACCNMVAENSSGTSLIMGPDGEPLVILPPNREAFGIATINLITSADWSIWRDRLGPFLLNQQGARPSKG
jgi:N-carbamoylputrescine amidase